MKSFPGRFKISYSGFVIPESGQLFAAKLEMFNYETTIDSIRLFLSEHPAPEGKKYALVMDNAPWHKKTMRLVEKEMLPEYSDIKSLLYQVASVFSGSESYRAGLAHNEEGEYAQCVLCFVVGP